MYSTDAQIIFEDQQELLSISLGFWQRNFPGTDYAADFHRHVIVEVRIIPTRSTNRLYVLSLNRINSRRFAASARVILTQGE